MNLRGDGVGEKEKSWQDKELQRRFTRLLITKLGANTMNQPMDVQPGRLFYNKTVRSVQCTRNTHVPQKEL
jgi:hypothetical protein